jgi:hypothetical protein
MDQPKPLRLQPVDSSAIRGIAYDRATRWLFVDYRSARRGLYAYRDVSTAEWRMLHRAASIGRYVNSRIKPHHEFVKLDESTKRAPGAESR